MHIKSLKPCFSHSKTPIHLSYDYYCYSPIHLSYYYYYCYCCYQGLNEVTISYHYKVFQTWDLATYLISWIVTLIYYKKGINEIILMVLKVLT